MKKRLIFTFFLTAILSLSFATVLAVKSNNTIDVESYSKSELPTTIDLNDSTESDIRSYYSALNSLSTSERQGDNLLKNLKTILKNGQKYCSYDSGSGTSIWQMYEITDRDWSKSPASSTTYGTYNSKTNTITDYVYGTSSSSSKNNPYIHALYVNRNVNNQVTAWDNHQQNQWGINREHVWAKAEGFDTSGDGGARGDPMHLMAGNGYANNIHSNYFYGYVDTSSGYTNCGSKYSNLSGNFLGKSKTLGGSTNVFEPQDSDKGDIARAIFYMVARYNYLSGKDSDGIDSDNPNLSLSQSLSDWSITGYTSSTSRKGYMGIMTDLLAWHHADPVDEYEIHRNNLLYTNYTNNRNPFIDFPEWADFIWGSVNYNGKNYISHSTTPTGYATPSTDTVNGYNSGGEVISVTGISLNKASTSIEAGYSEELVPTITPTNATNQTITWTSSDNSIATVSGGIVTGVSEGTATITATTNDGGFTASCIVTITPAQGGGGTATIDGGVDAASGALSGWTAAGTGSAYADGSVKFDSSGDNVYKTDIFSNEVASAMSELTVTINGKINGTPKDNNAYKVEALDQSGNVLASVTKTGADIVTTSYGDTVFTFDSDLIGCTGIKITYQTKGGGNWGVKSVSWTATYSEQPEVTLSSIAVKTAPTKVTYTAGDGFDANGLVITATYSDKTTLDIPYQDNEDSFEFDPVDNLQTTDTSITITYGGKSCTQAITVNASKTLSSISLNTENVKKTYKINETFNHDNLVVTAHYSDSSSEVVSSSATVSTPDMSTTGEKTVTVSYTYEGETKTATYTISVVAPSSITAVVNNEKTFYVGETITKDDITVTTDLGDDVTEYVTFNDYQFTYDDADSGGALTDRGFTINYQTLSGTLTAKVQRKAHVVPSEVTDLLNRDFTDVTGTTYTAWEKSAPNSAAIYSGNTAGSNESIQMRSNNETSGIVTKASAGKALEVTVVWNENTQNGRSIDIYGKNSTYNSPADLYVSAKQGTKLGSIKYGTSTKLTISGSYDYIGIRSASGALYLTSISITYNAVDSANNLSNYIMFEDTQNQCETKTSVATTYFEGLSVAERNTFMTSTDYVISTARERFNAWLKHEGKSIVSSNGDYEISKVVDVYSITEIIDDNNTSMILIIVMAATSMSLLVLVLLKRKRRR